MPSAGLRVRITELSPTTLLITFVGDLGAASAAVIRQVLSDYGRPGRHLLVDVSHAERPERTAPVLPAAEGDCVVITGGRPLTSPVPTVATVAEARAMLATEGLEPPSATTDRPTTELDLRALRNRALVADAIDVVRHRYDLPGPESAFTALARASQQHNVPVRILAAAVLRAPAPTGPTWFPGRRKTPQPPLSFPAGPQAARTVRSVLRSLLAVVIRATDAAGGSAQSIAPLDDGLALECQHGMPETPVRDFAWIALTDPTPCARAHRARVRVDADLSTGTEISPVVQHALLAHGVRRICSTPLCASSGRSLGVVSTHHADTADLDDDVVRMVDGLAGETGHWLDWHRRTVVFDALERLHQLAGAPAGA